MRLSPQLLSALNEWDKRTVPDERKAKPFCVALQRYLHPTEGGISPPEGRFHPPEADFTPRRGISPFRRKVCLISQLTLTASPRGEAILRCFATLPQPRQRRDFTLQSRISPPEGRFHPPQADFTLSKKPRRLLLRGFFCFLYANAARRFFALSRASSVWWGAGAPGISLLFTLFSMAIKS